MFFLLPIGVDYRARRYPVVTFTLMGICVAVYLITLALRLAHGTDVLEWVYANLWLIPSESHWWTYVTSLFVHEGFFHLAGNMVYLFLFGACVEDVMGRARFSVFYLICGFASELMHVAIAPGHFASEVALGGASGAISGCIGGFLLIFLRTKIEFKWVFFFWFRIWSGDFFLPAWLVISFWFLWDFGMMILTMFLNTEGSGVAFGAHVGGTLCGVALMSVAKLFKKSLLLAEEEDEEQIEAPKQIKRGPIRVVLKTAPAGATEIASIYLIQNETQAGPYTPSQVQNMFIIGSISGDALYWQEGMSDWSSAEELRPPGTLRAG
jgi:membrane associated rhomboid family serine protease